MNSQTGKRKKAILENNRKCSLHDIKIRQRKNISLGAVNLSLSGRARVNATLFAVDFRWKLRLTVRCVNFELSESLSTLFNWCVDFNYVEVFPFVDVRLRICDFLHRAIRRASSAKVDKSLPVRGIERATDRRKWWMSNDPDCLFIFNARRHRWSCLARNSRDWRTFARSSYR